MNALFNIDERIAEVLDGGEEDRDAPDFGAGT
jgi:hypothetical protein